MSMRLIVWLLALTSKRVSALEFTIQSRYRPGWRKVPIWHPARLWFSYRRWVWDTNDAMLAEFDGQWEYATEQQVARAYLEEQFKPKASSALLFD